MFFFSTVIYLLFSVRMVTEGFDLFGFYTMASSFFFLQYCNSNLNRELIIETMMRIAVFDTFTNPQKKKSVEKMMKESMTFEEYMKTAKKEKDGDKFETE